MFRPMGLRRGEGPCIFFGLSVGLLFINGSLVFSSFLCLAR